MSLIDGLQTQSVSETVFQKIVISVRYIMKKTLIMRQARAMRTRTRQLRARTKKAVHVI